MNKKQVISSLIFILFFLVLFDIVTNIFIPKWDGFWQATRIAQGYYEVPDDSIDTLVLGSSQVITGVDPEVLDSYGLNSVLRGSERQTMLSSYYLLLDTENNQSIDTVVIDTLSLFDTGLEAFDRKVYDNMKFSWVKYQAVSALCEEDEDQSLLSYIFPIVRYHSRWDSLTAEDFKYLLTDKEDLSKGFVSTNTIYKSEYFEGFSADSATEEARFEDVSLKYFLKIVDYCKENDIQLVLIKTPNEEWYDYNYAAVQSLADEYGLTYIDFNLDETISATGFDPMKDFYDANHVNLSGAYKITDYIAKNITK